MVSKGALAKMNYSELLELRKRVDDAIELRYSQERRQLTEEPVRDSKADGSRC